MSILIKTWGQKDSYHSLAGYRMHARVYIDSDFVREWFMIQMNSANVLVKFSIECAEDLAAGSVLQNDLK